MCSHHCLTTGPKATFKTMSQNKSFPLSLAYLKYFVNEGKLIHTQKDFLFALWNAHSSNFIIRNVGDKLFESLVRIEMVVFNFILFKAFFSFSNAQSF
jgi:hypothetical protein